MRAHQPYTEQKEQQIMAENPIEVGGPYVENEDFVPNATDMQKQFNTSGVGAHDKIEEVSAVFDVDRVKIAQEIEGALDPENKSVSASRVILPNLTTDNEAAKEEILAVAAARLDEGVVIGGPTPAQREAEKDGDEGVDAAVEQERSNAAANSTGHNSAGQHSSNTPASTDGKGVGTGSQGTKGDDDSTLTGPKGGDAAKKTAAPSTAKKETDAKS